MVAITVCSCLINLASVRVASAISTDFAAKLRGAVFDQVQTFSSAEMDKFGTASLVTHSTSDITNVQNFLTLLLRVGMLAPDDGHCRAGLFLSHWRQGEFGACHRHSGAAGRAVHHCGAGLPLLHPAAAEAGPRSTGCSWSRWKGSG